MYNILNLNVEQINGAIKNSGYDAVANGTTYVGLSKGEAMYSIDGWHSCSTSYVKLCSFVYVHEFDDELYADF